MAYICKKCGGTDVQLLAWVNPNDESKVDFSASEDGEETGTWCTPCADNTGIDCE